MLVCMHANYMSMNLAIYLIYFNIDAEKPLSGTLNKAYVCMYVVGDVI